MATRTRHRTSALDRLRRRYETPHKKCPACGFVDETRDWPSQTDGSRVVYRHVCPGCGASREHTFRSRG
jgi:RNA polymerase subunit RPABC4/transcription elongation factor Spt4